MTRAEEIFDTAFNACELPEDAVGNELRVFGPPGTGKTTLLAAHVERAAARFGPKGVLVMSHTRAAAHELVRRKVALAEQNVATLHSVCFRALGKPRIAETKGLREKWNERYPNWSLSEHAQQTEELPQETRGDRELRELNQLRATLTPQDRWPSSLRPFWLTWSAWKKTEGALDFTDLIEEAWRKVPVAPGNPAVIICDEAQDFTSLQLALIRSWAKACHYLVLAGDEDQSLYAYAGASPLNLLTPPLPPHQIRVLRQSHRVPASVHRYAHAQWTNRLAVRQEKEFHPRSAPGCVRRIKAGAFDPERLVNRLERSVAEGKETMLLATANFALSNVLAELRRRGVPFANRYRPENLKWNPMGGKGHGAASRVRALLAARERFDHPHGLWTGSQVRLWCAWLATAGTLKRGTKELLQSLDFERFYGTEWLDEHVEAEARTSLLSVLERGPAATAEWWRRRVLPDYQRDAQYVANVVIRSGADRLAETPKLTVGTIHSVKGGSAEAVYLLPDLTNRWKADDNAGGTRRDSLLRLFYVASTRTSDELWLCDPFRRGSSMFLGAGI